MSCETCRKRRRDDYCTQHKLYVFKSGTCAYDETVEDGFTEQTCSECNFFSRERDDYCERHKCFTYSSETCQDFEKK